MTESTGFFVFTVAEGRVAEATADIQALARRYGADPGKYAGQDRVSYRIRVERVFEYR